MASNHICSWRWTDVFSFQPVVGGKRDCSSGGPFFMSATDLSKPVLGRGKSWACASCSTALPHPAFSCSLNKEPRASCGPIYLHKQHTGVQFGHVCHPLLSSCCLTWAFGLSLASLAFGDSCYHISYMSCSVHGASAGQESWCSVEARTESCLKSVIISQGHGD